MLDGDASTAKTLTLVAMVFQAIFFVIGIFEVIAVIAVFSLTARIVATPGYNGPLVIISLVFSVALLMGILWIALDYFLVYKRLATEMVQEAKTPSIVLGIIQLIFGGLVPGILLIIAYVKIRDSLSRHNVTPQIPPP
ncbi:MAG: hypothetical protein M0Z77_04495 [Thermoplasmatales archaeon]|nr:hypothetical protein [Thermoplasmatales archaeon]